MSSEEPKFGPLPEPAEAGIIEKANALAAKLRGHKTYNVSEIFYSIQGEGVRAGTVNVFCRFSGCNLRCASADSSVGWNCDTEFSSGKEMTLDEISSSIRLARDYGSKQHMGITVGNGCEWIVLTGGEPALQVDREFCHYFRERGYKLAIETNGTVELPKEDYLSGECDDVRCTDNLSLIGWDCGSRLPEPALVRPSPIKTGMWNGHCLDWICVSPKTAEHTIRQTMAHELRYVRCVGQEIPVPACKALHYILSPAMGTDQDEKANVAHCVDLVKRNPQWRLSLPLHKIIGIR